MSRWQVRRHTPRRNEAANRYHLTDRWAVIKVMSCRAYHVYLFCLPSPFFTDWICKNAKKVVIPWHLCLGNVQIFSLKDDPWIITGFWIWSLSLFYLFRHTNTCLIIFQLMWTVRQSLLTNTFLGKIIMKMTVTHIEVSLCSITWAALSSVLQRVPHGAGSSFQCKLYKVLLF